MHPGKMQKCPVFDFNCLWIVGGTFRPCSGAKFEPLGPLRRNAGRNRKRRKIVNADGGKKKRNGSVAKRGVVSAKRRNAFVKKRSCVASTSLPVGISWRVVKAVNKCLFNYGGLHDLHGSAKVWFLQSLISLTLNFCKAFASCFWMHVRCKLIGVERSFDLCPWFKKKFVVKKKVWV